MEPVVCEARVVNRGGRTAFAEASVKDRAGKLYAHGASTLMILKL
jgi:acyl-coenzyme A thioesterase PaaI-like protein